MSTASATAVDVAASVLARRAGLRIEDSMRGRLTRCLADEATARRVGIDDYAHRLDSDAAALQSLLNGLTVQETAFFRDPAHFAALADVVLPTLDRPLTIWSAGCANGQEPYSLVMLLDTLGDHVSTVVASDISTLALERARAARYSRREVAGLSPEYRERYLTRTGRDEFEVVPAVRDRVEFVHHNLADDVPPFAPATCPIVFCRNVLIYFTPADTVRVLNRLADWMTPDGMLFLGYSESLWQITDRFQLERLGTAFAYRRRQPGAHPSAPRRQRVDAARPKATRRAKPLRAAQQRASADAEGSVTKGSVAEGSVDVTVEELLDQGESASRVGDLAAAITSFRKCVYLDPDRVIAHFHLGLALEATNDVPAAQRAFASALAALDRGGRSAAEDSLEGYDLDELARVLGARITTPDREDTP